MPASPARFLRVNHGLAACRLAAMLICGSVLLGAGPVFSALMPYAFWKTHYDLLEGAAGDTDDPDGDGCSNLEEYYSGTNPTLPESHEQPACSLLPTGQLLISYRRAKTSTNVTVNLLTATNLSSPDWLPLETNPGDVIVLDQGTHEETQVRLGPLGPGARFFRLRLQDTSAPRPSFSFHDWLPAADGVTDDGPKFKAFFQAVKSAGGGQVRIPPGIYFIRVASSNQCAVPSDTRVEAGEAVFRFSETVGSGTVFTWFYEFDVQNFVWKGGTFEGYAFDLDRNPHTLNTWHPNAHVRCFHLRTSKGGRTANIVFEGVQTSGIQGTAITVAGNLDDYYRVNTYAENVTLRRCRLIRTGPRLWDYGFIWQLLVWDYEYDDNFRSLGNTYFDPTVFRAPVTPVGDRIELNNSAGKIVVSTNGSLTQTVCFYGTQVDSSLVRGLAYFVVAADASHIKVSRTVGGPPILLNGDAVEMKVMNNVFQAFYPLLTPMGTPPGDEAKHGAFMVDAARDVRAVDNYIERGNGDAMLIKISTNVTFTGNEIRGARMGAVWIGDLCENVLIRSNIVDGGKGSRVLSVERYSKNVVVSDNFFFNGGRGAWINQPRGVLVSNNVFEVNAGKNTPDPYVGRRSYQTGQYDLWDQVYFTYDSIPPYGGQKWGPVVVVSNVVDSGFGNLPPQALRFHSGLTNLYIAYNTFRGASSNFWIESGVEGVTFGPNTGILTTNFGRFTQTVAFTAPSIRIPHGLADNSPFLSCVPTVVPNNPESAVARVDVTDTEMVVVFQTPVPPGRTIDLTWYAYLKWK